VADELIGVDPNVMRSRPSCVTCSGWTGRPLAPSKNGISLSAGSPEGTNAQEETHALDVWSRAPTAPAILGQTGRRRDGTVSRKTLRLECAISLLALVSSLVVLHFQQTVRKPSW
jgi:hypothetical protein